MEKEKKASQSAHFVLIISPNVLIMYRCTHEITNYT
ncbi:MAG: hypothetical protein H6Q54_1995 [Deltaproteobacteria bacterium]|nr:hypothetical protein [Deltaproteobacteria bacterium]